MVMCKQRASGNGQQHYIVHNRLSKIQLSSIIDLAGDRLQQGMQRSWNPCASATLKKQEVSKLQR
jgi:hypothetical protein